MELNKKEYTWWAEDYPCNGKFSTIEECLKDAHYYYENGYDDMFDYDLDENGIETENLYPVVNIGIIQYPDIENVVNSLFACIQENGFNIDELKDCMYNYLYVTFDIDSDVVLKNKSNKCISDHDLEELYDAYITRHLYNDNEFKVMLKAWAVNTIPDGMCEATPMFEYNLKTKQKHWI